MRRDRPPRHGGAVRSDSCLPLDHPGAEGIAAQVLCKEPDRRLRRLGLGYGRDRSPASAHADKRIGESVSVPIGPPAPAGRDQVATACLFPGVPQGHLAGPACPAADRREHQDIPTDQRPEADAIEPDRDTE